MLIKIVILLCIITILCIVNIHFKRIKRRNLFLALISGAYLVTLFSFTFLGRVPFPEKLFILNPFESYVSILFVRWYGCGEYILRAIVGNVLIFVPLGLLMGNMLDIKSKYLIIAGIGFFLSLAIEAAQYITMLGTFEVDDLINNTWGAVIGCAMTVALRRKENSIRKNLIILLPLLVFIVVVIAVCTVPVAKEILILF